MTTLEPARRRRKKTGLMRLICADVDGTMLGGAAEIQRFNAAWRALSCNARPRLVYSSSRSAAEIRFDIAVNRLPPGDYVIGGLGTQLYDGHTGGFVAEFPMRFTSPGWNRATVTAIVAATPEVAPQGTDNQLPHKSSWVWPRAPRADLDALRVRLAAAGLNVRVIFSGGRWLDVVPAAAGKGEALAWLCQRLGISLRTVVVAGDSGNDREMFELRDVRQIVLANADADLRQAARRRRAIFTRTPCVDGVVEGLKFFGVLDAITPAAT